MARMQHTDRLRTSQVDCIVEMVLPYQFCLELTYISLRGLNQQF